MADIFISYKKEDAGRVIRMVEALRADGFDVWWDHGIKAGSEWDRSIHKELYAAKVVIAIWSNAPSPRRGSRKRRPSARTAACWCLRRSTRSIRRSAS